MCNDLRVRHAKNLHDTCELLLLILAWEDNRVVGFVIVEIAGNVHVTGAESGGGGGKGVVRMVGWGRIGAASRQRGSDAEDIVRPRRG